jgi:DNA-directed RNA polymerase alpha subunit
MPEASLQEELKAAFQKSYDDGFRDGKESARLEIHIALVELNRTTIADLEFLVGDLGLSERPRNCLARAQIRTIRDLIDKTDADLRSITNFGDSALTEVKERLAQRGLKLREK